LVGQAADPKAIELSSEAKFRVGSAIVDPVSHEAAFNGSTERIQPQNLKVLIALAQNRGRVVTRDELVERCWSGRFVSEDVINRAISTLRQFAGRAGGFEIETVPRSGYRLVEAAKAKWKPRLAAAAIGAFMIVGVLAATREARRATDSTPGPLSFAVLPFQTGEADPATRAVAFAARDSVSHAFSQTRFALVQVAPDARGTPGADFLLSGAVSSTPAGINVTVQIEEAANHIVVYSHQFSSDRAGRWSLAETIGPQVAGSLGWMEPMLRADHRYPSNPQIVGDLFQQFDVEQVDWLSEYERTRRVAAAAPNSAVAQLALASSIASYLPAFPREQRADVLALGRIAEMRAESLAPDLGDAQAIWCLLHSRAEMVECDSRLRGALRRDPTSPWADYTLADRLKDAGRMEEALDLARHSLAADEFAPPKIGLTLRLLEATGQSDGAEELYRQARRWWPRSGIIIWDRVYGIIDRGDFDALQAFIRELARDKPVWGSDLELSFAPVPSLAAAVKSHDVGAARRLCPLDQPGSLRRDLCMLAYAKIGDSSDGVSLASRIFPDRVGRSHADEERTFLDAPSVTDADILTGSAAAPLRRDPRYVDVARGLGLFAYWRSGELPDFCRAPHAEPVCKSLKA
jgi:DNA-binding winged helix-turn-helix (wHTH) protein/TolB-like protein/tetratricopeptide (TPR) repeat protein